MSIISIKIEYAIEYIHFYNLIMNRLLIVRRCFTTSWFDTALKQGTELSKTTFKQGEELATQLMEGKQSAVNLYVDNQLQLIQNLERSMLRKMRSGDEINVSISSNLGIFNSTISKTVKKI